LLILIALLVCPTSGCNSTETSAVISTPSVNYENENDTNTSSSDYSDIITEKNENKNEAEDIELDRASLSHEGISWSFHRNSEHLPPQGYVDDDMKALMEKMDAFYLIKNDENKIYLTFDEGYVLGYTGQILDILKTNDVKAVFFITGHYIQTHPELVKRMREEGHMVGNHTWNHPDMSTLSTEELEEEVKSLEKAFYDLTGTEMDKYLRPPMGRFSAASLYDTYNLGYSTVFWSMAFKDWDPNNQPGAEVSYQHVMDNIHPGAIILLHAVSESNTKALDRILNSLKQQGYQFALPANQTAKAEPTP